MLPLLALALAPPPTGRGVPTLPSAPAGISTIARTAAAVDWSGYPEPLGFEGYRLRTVTVAGTAWEAATPYGGLTTAAIVPLTALPAAAVELLVKPVANGLEAIAAARADVTAGGGAGGGGGGGGSGGSITAADWKKPNIAGKTAVNVGSLAAWNGVKASLNPATQYVVITARFAGFTVDRGGTEAHPLVITCAMPAAEADWLDFTGRNGFDDGNCELAAEWIWLFGLKVRRTSRLDKTPAVHLKADHLFVTCCQLDAPKGELNAAGASASHDWHIGYNEHTGLCDPTAGLGDANEAQTYLYTGADGQKQPDYGDIYRNIYRQSGEPGGTENHCVYTGNGKADPSGNRDRPYDISLRNVTVRNNLIATRRTRAIYLKHPVGDVYGNHIVAVDAWNSLTPRASGGPLQMCSHRGQNTIRGRMRRNRIEGGQQMGLQGWDCLWEGNVLSNGAEFVLFTHCDNPSNPKTLLGANGALLLGNVGPVVIAAVRAGGGFGPYASDPLRDVTIEGHAGTVKNDSGATINFGAAQADGYSRPIAAIPYCTTSTIRKKATTALAYDPPPRYTLDTAGPRAPGLTWGGAAGGGGGGGGVGTPELTLGAAYTTNWKHKTQGGTISQPSAGRVRMAGGVADLAVPASLLTIGRIFSEYLLAKPFEVELKVTRKLIPGSTTTHGGFCQAGIVLPTASAPGPRPADWPAATNMQDEEIARIVTGWRVTHANINTTGSAQSNKLRLQRYNGTPTASRTPVDSDVDEVVDWGLNVERTLRVRWTGSQVRAECVELGKVATFTHPALGSISQGYLMYTVSYDMDTIVADIRRLS